MGECVCQSRFSRASGTEVKHSCTDQSGVCSDLCVPDNPYSPFAASTHAFEATARSFSSPLFHFCDHSWHFLFLILSLCREYDDLMGAGDNKELYRKVSPYIPEIKR